MTLRSKAVLGSLLVTLCFALVGCSSESVDPASAQKAIDQGRNNPVPLTKAGKSNVSGAEVGDVVAAPAGVKTGIPDPGAKSGGK